MPLVVSSSSAVVPTSYTEAIPLLADVEQLKLRPYPRLEDDEIDRPWDYDTVEGYCVSKPRVLRVTRLGTAFLTDEDAQVVGTIPLKDVGAILPIYDADEGAPLPDTGVLVSKEDRKPLLFLRMDGEKFEALSELVMLYSHAPKRAVSQYREARAVTRFGRAYARKAREMDDEARAAQEADDEAALAAVLFGRQIDPTKEALPNAAPGDDETDLEDDDELRAALGLEPKPKTSDVEIVSNPDSEPPAEDPVAKQFDGPPAPDALLNPFRFGIGTLQRDAPAVQDGREVYTMREALAVRHAARLQKSDITDFINECEVLRHRDCERQRQEALVAYRTGIELARRQQQLCRDAVSGHRGMATWSFSGGSAAPRATSPRRLRTADM